jgi:hypothetical protein
LQIASGDYTSTQQDASAGEGNQQPAKQLWHTRENNTKTNIAKNAWPRSAKTSSLGAPPPQHSGRYVLGFPLKLSHAPLQVACPQNHKLTIPIPAGLIS